MIDDRYRILELLGRGGMGSVYRGEHLALRQTVAIKVLRPSMARWGDAVQRFIQEARAAARIDHHLRIEADGFETQQRTVRLAPGVAERLTVQLTPLGSDVTSEAWFWVVLVGAAALVGGGVGLGLYLNQQQDYDGGSLDMVFFNLVEF